MFYLHSLLSGGVLGGFTVRESVSLYTKPEGKCEIHHKNLPTWLHVSLLHFTQYK